MVASQSTAAQWQQSSIFCFAELQNVTKTCGDVFDNRCGSETKNILCYEKSCHILQLQGTWNVENAQKYTRHVKVKLSTETFAQNCLIWHVEKPFTMPRKNQF